MSAVDVHGRVVSQAVLGCLDWALGTRVQMRVLSRSIAVTVSADGPQTVLSRGALRLPAGLRRLCNLQPGERVLLAADQASGVLLVHPPAVLDTVLPHGDGANDGARP